jgi:signal transduction histidine kinase
VIVEHTLLYEESRAVAVLEERNRMAREIHDTLAQGFTGIVLQLEAAEGTLDRNREPDEVRGHLTSAKNLARRSLGEARRSVWNLLPRELEEQSLEDALREVVQRFEADSGERASFGISGQRRELPIDIQAALLRICQEALTNVVKHAHATDVQVELAFEPASVLLRVRDNGLGFDVEQAKARPRGRGGGFGLSGMEQRTRLLSGSLTLIRNDEGGMLVEANLPTR